MAIYKYKTKKDGSLYMVRYRNKTKRGFKNKEVAFQYEEMKKQNARRADQLYKEYIKSGGNIDERRKDKQD